jgi:hypothetical protein
LASTTIRPKELLAILSAVLELPAGDIGEAGAADAGAEDAGDDDPGAVEGAEEVELDEHAARLATASSDTAAVLVHPARRGDVRLIM